MHCYVFRNRVESTCCVIVDADKNRSENTEKYGGNLVTKINQQEKEKMTMKKYECGPCGYIYDPAVGDPDGGIAPGTAFEDIPDDWVCPLCGLGKDVFVPVED